MADSKHDIEEINKLQREAAELQAELKQARSASQIKDKNEVDDTTAEKSSAAPPQPDSTEESTIADLEQTLADSSHQLAGLIRQIEDATVQRPALALLAALTIGIAIGQLFSRK